MKRPVRIIILVILSLILLLLLSGWVLPRFLKLNSPVSSNNILIESWISAFEIEQAIQEYKSNPETHFYLVGMEYPADCVNSNEIKDYHAHVGNGIWLYTSSSLIIQIPDTPIYRKYDTIQVSVKAKGEQAGGVFAHFNLLVDGHNIGGIFSTENEQEYIFQYILPTETINSIVIRFTNDLWTEEADRNLNVGWVKINDDLIFPGDVPVYLTREQNQKTTGFISQADAVADYLVQIGIERNRITIIRFNHKTRNRTREASMAFKNSTASNKMDNINIVTSGIHSRRTWVTYSNILGSNMDVGVAYFPDSPTKTKADLLKGEYYMTIFNEFLSYLANWITLNLRTN
jgi:hypothetical protein